VDPPDRDRAKFLKDELKPNCHKAKDAYLKPGTRKKVLQEIRDWADAADSPNILWLSGEPGAGKSAIAVTLQMSCAREGVLVLSFTLSEIVSRTRRICGQRSHSISGNPIHSLRLK
jgi:DNA replication protein DnaC